LVCPTFGPPAKPQTLHEKKDHTVILSWTASAPADSKHSDAVGYCIYRSEKRGDKSPELVNSISFPGASCMDDMVENGKKYYYVVRAISARRIPSIPSNVATASIPSGEGKKASVSGNTAPLCREANVK
jgi:fibronectin type 3 domain-containing protein